MTDLHLLIAFMWCFQVDCLSHSGVLARRGRPATHKRGVHQTPHALCDNMSSALYSTVRSLCGLRSRDASRHQREKHIIVLPLITTRCELVEQISTNWGKYY